MFNLRLQTFVRFLSATADRDDNKNLAKLNLVTPSEAEGELTLATKRTEALRRWAKEQTLSERSELGILSF